MSAVQRTIPFNVRKVNSRSSFYRKNESPVVKKDFSNATVRTKSSESNRTPTVKKVVVLTSSESESSDSDLENAIVEPKGNATCQRKRIAHRTPTKKKNDQESDGNYRIVGSTLFPKRILFHRLFLFLKFYQTRTEARRQS